MKKLLILIGVAGLSGCAAPTHDSSNLKGLIQQTEAGDFGTLLTEMHKAEDELQTAQEIVDDLDVHYDSVGAGEAAASRALQHRQNAEQALNNILQPIRDQLEDHENRLTYIESLHVAQGTPNPEASLFFAFDSSFIAADEMQKLDEIVTFVREHPIFSIHLTGYTDTVGTERYNKGLARRRNNSVERALRHLGVPTSTAILVAVGEDFAPPPPDNTLHPESRRVDISIKPHGKYRL